MAHYAVLDANNVVVFVHPGKDEGVDGVDWEEYYGAKRTSYNTFGGVHYSDGQPSADQSKAFRYNFAGVGFTFDPTFGPDGAFIPPQPFPSWSLNPESANWVPPIPQPARVKGDPLYRWNESTMTWDAVVSSGA